MSVRACPNEFVPVCWTNVGHVLSQGGFRRGENKEQDRYSRSPKKLKQSGKPSFEGLEKGLDFGYRKGKRGGSWVIRRYLGERKYAIETIGGR